MNSMTMIQRGWFLMRCLMITAGLATSSGWAAEYEVDGIILQKIVEFNGSQLEYSNNFTVYVRDSSWLIRIDDTNMQGGIWRRELGSTNGTEICETSANLPVADPAKPADANSNQPARGRPAGAGVAFTQAFITPGAMPVELGDKGVAGHLWLMFASQSYWTNLHTSQLTPVYDWHASIGFNPSAKVEATWDLLAGPGSLPREVRYLGQWEETNGLYRVTGTNSVAGMLMPSRFFFEESQVGPLLENSLIHGMTVRKRVDAVVTAFRPVCSRKSLLPILGRGASIIDWRLRTPDSGSDVPIYNISESENLQAGDWPSVEQAGKMLKAQ